MYSTTNSLMCLPLFSYDAGQAEEEEEEGKGGQEDCPLINSKKADGKHGGHGETRDVLGVIVYVGKGNEVSAGGMTVKDTAASFSEEDEFLATVWSHFLSRVVSVSCEVDSMIRQQERKDAMFNCKF